MTIELRLPSPISVFDRRHGGRNDRPLPQAAGLNNPVIRLRQGLRRDKSVFAKGYAATSKMAGLTDFEIATAFGLAMTEGRADT
ncbi:MAG: hypothetical protein PHY02_07870 [Phycisphaerae bacterium]|nr:hypothetical protein [Phycisphaerae bacterium]